MVKVYLAACVAAIIVVGFSIYPQYRLQHLRGSDFKGAFATYDLDETAYAAYLQALIDGRPRKNDPYTGRDDSTTDPQPESIFSIQFATAYPAALIARTFGMSATEAMPAISVVSALLTALALFGLIYLICADAWMSLAGTLAVIAGGALISGIGVIGMFPEGGVAYPYLPLFRRHIPSLSFPFVFGYLALLYAALKAEGNRRRVFYVLIAAICFGVLLFSYFYLWTSALAILGIIGLLLLTWSHKRRSSDLMPVAAAGACAVVLLIPYAYLLSKRNIAVDSAQLLVYTHAPDLTRNIELIGACVAILALLFAIKKLGWLERLNAVFIGGFGLSAVLVFNQQVITGRSLQPFHYEYYSVNYVVLLALVLFVILTIQRMFARYRLIATCIALLVAIAAAGWGTFETYETTRFWDDLNIARDDAMPINRRLNAIAKSLSADPRTLVTINFDSLQGDGQPTVAPFAVLWARHQNAFAGIVNSDESRLRYYKLLYYSGLDDVWLRKALTDCSDIEACMTLFGWDRFNATLSANARGLTRPEIEREIRLFARFVETFGKEQAYMPLLSFAIARKGENLSPSLSRWYEIGDAEDVGDFAVYRLAPKPN